MFDSTPVKICFGQLRDKVAPLARFWWKDRGKPKASWTLLPLSELQRRSKSDNFPRWGVVEMLGESARVAFPETVVSPTGKPFVAVHSHELAIAPSFVHSCSASCQLAAVLSSVPELDLASLMELAKYVKFVVLCLGSDGAAACGRFTHESRYHS